MSEKNVTPKKLLILKKEDIRHIHVRTDLRTGLNVQTKQNGQANCNTIGCNTTSVPVLKM